MVRGGEAARGGVVAVGCSEVAKQGADEVIRGGGVAA